MKFFKKVRKARKVETTTNKNKSHIPFRLNFLFLIVFLLFAALIGQLAYLQILHGTMFESEVSSSETETETQNVQRGQIYDSSGKVLVSNKSSRAITYTKPLSVTNTQMYSVAKYLSNYISVSTSSLTATNKADFYLAKHESEVDKKITGSSSMSSSELYKAELAYVKKHKLYAGMTHKQKEIAILYSKMSNAYSLSTVYLKAQGVTDKEMSEVGEHLSEMEGIKIGTNWRRSYPAGSSVKSIIGTVTTEKTGLPSDSINELLAEGYSRNDSVGSSYIESQYENVLKGTKKTINVETQNGKVLKETTQYGGKKGDNVVLTINEKFQKKVQKYLMSAVNSVKSSNPYMPGAYVAVINPNTGAIYALAGASRNLSTNKVTANALGTLNQTYVMGSVVKGAQVLGGLTSGVITPSSNTLYDEPIKLKGTATKASWFNKTGADDMSLTAEQALEISSNVYMMKLTMLEAGYTYKSGSALTMPSSIFTTLRNNFNQFGLGVKTGIDIPGESIGYAGASGQSNIGKALDLSFGNYDSYTTIQLAQYVSMIANGGYRLQPHILQSIRESNKNGTLGKTVYEFEPNVLNVYNASSSEWNVVKTGFYDVVHGSMSSRTGTALESLTPEVSAKTGTAQTYHGTTETITHSLVMYGPSNNAKVAMAIVFPGMDSSSSGSVTTTLASEVYKAFWKTVRSSKGISTTTSDNGSGGND